MNALKLSLVSFVLAAVGCSSAPSPSPGDDTQAQTKNPTNEKKPASNATTPPPAAPAAPSGQPSSTPGPDPSKCAAKTTTDECITCCDPSGAQKTGDDVFTQCSQPCDSVCTSGTSSGGSSGSSGSDPTDPSTSACDQCLLNAQCDTKAKAACDASATCKTAAACIESASCSSKADPGGPVGSSSGGV